MKDIQLNLKDLINGCSLCLQNAGELKNEAIILFEHRKYERTVFLLTTSCEELGKYYLMLTTIENIINGNDIDWKGFWNDFYYHPKKLGAFIARHLRYIKTIETGEDLRQISCNFNLDNKRLLYTDFIYEKDENCNIIGGFCNPRLYYDYLEEGSSFYMLLMKTLFKLIPIVIENGNKKIEDILQP